MPRTSFIRWTGSKRFLSPEILALSPTTIETYWEPFLGSGFLVSLFKDRAKRVVGLDVIPQLIQLFNIVKDSPGELIENYRKIQQESEDKKALFHKVRDRFNTTFSPYDFFYLAKTSNNGLIRFNSKGQFNACVQYKNGSAEGGASVENVARTVNEWFYVLNEIPMEFRNQSFETILPEVQKGDFVFLDPPYLQSKLYSNMVPLEDIESFLDTLNRKEVRWLFTFGGVHGDKDQTVEINPSLYKEMGYFAPRRGKFEAHQMVRESWYRNYNGSQI